MTPDPETLMYRGNLLPHNYSAHVDRQELWRNRDDVLGIPEHRHRVHKRRVEVPADLLFDRH